MAGGMPFLKTSKPRKVVAELLPELTAAVVVVGVAGELAAGAVDAPAVVARKHVRQAAKPLGGGPRASTRCS